MIDLPEPPKCPVALWRWLRQARTAIRTFRPTQGPGIIVGEEIDKGSPISTMAPPGTGSGGGGGGTINVAGGNTYDEAHDGDHEVENVSLLTTIGWGDPKPVVPGVAGEAVLDVFPTRDDLDTSKQYACVFVYESGEWQLELREICTA